jgi:hypothetical protein
LPWKLRLELPPAARNNVRTTTGLFARRSQSSLFCSL